MFESPLAKPKKPHYHHHQIFQMNNLFPIINFCVRAHQKFYEPIKLRKDFYPNLSFVLFLYFELLRILARKHPTNHVREKNKRRFKNWALIRNTNRIIWAILNWVKHVRTHRNSTERQEFSSPSDFTSVPYWIERSEQEANKEWSWPIRNAHY